MCRLQAVSIQMCEHCGDGFTAKGTGASTKRYCTERCRETARAQRQRKRFALRESKRCPRCEKMVPGEEFGTGNGYCRACYREYARPRMRTYMREREGRIPPTCLECGKIFSDDVTWSGECCSEACKEKRELRQCAWKNEPVLCVFCDKPFLRRKRAVRFCRDCRGLGRRCKMAFATPEQYREAVRRQKGFCASCHSPFGDKTPHLDHCHKTHTFRSLLCQGCNCAAGHMRDSSVLAMRLADYLRQYE